MTQYDGLRRIDISAARKEILRSITVYRNRHRLAELCTEFFGKMIDGGKQITRREGEKLQAVLVEQAPELKVYSVIVNKDKDVMDNNVYSFHVRMYDMDLPGCKLGDTKFLLRKKLDDGKFDLADTMVADMQWAKDADFLEAQLEKFAYNANKFNDLVDALARASMYAAPDGALFPVYPLSDYFHWYQLREADVRRG